MTAHDFEIPPKVLKQEHLSEFVNQGSPRQCDANTNTKIYVEVPEHQDAIVTMEDGQISKAGNNRNMATENTNGGEESYQNNGNYEFASKLDIVLR